MSAQDRHQKDNDPKAQPASPAEDASKPAGNAEQQKAGIKYVFKISPADPKRNSIDFEDVADK